MSSIHIEQEFDTVADQLACRLRRELPSGYEFQIAAGDASSRTPDWCETFHCVNQPDASVSGMCPPEQVPLMGALTRATLREIARDCELAQSQDCMNQYALQVTEDFEVLSWLRDLATQFEFCDVRNSMGEVATRVLPSLRRILAAETIAYIPADATLEVESSGSSDWVIDGPQLLSSVQLSELVQYHQDDSRSIVVLNADGVESSFANHKHVRHCMIARLGNGGERFGTIVVLNRSGERLEELTAEELAIGIEQFGTVEAGRLQSVVTMLVTHGRNLALVREKDSLLVGAIRSLIRAIDAKDAYTFGHSDRVALFGKRLAIEMGLSPQRCDEIYTTGLLHDIGKIGVPDAVLSKPGRLTDDEFNLIKQHPVHGFEILRDLQQLNYALGGVLHHHEHYDGTGYPNRLAGESIPLAGRILAVADAYDAMTSDRPYRNGMPTHRAEQILREGAGTQWDPQVVDAMMTAISDIHTIRQTHAVSAQSGNQPALTELGGQPTNGFRGYETSMDLQLA